MTQALHYVQEVSGLQAEADYPYTGVASTCKEQTSLKKVTVTDVNIIANYWDQEAELANYVQNIGPLTIAIGADSLNTYVSGILRDCNATINHAVQAVGVLPSSENGYWKLRNQWVHFNPN